MMLMDVILKVTVDPELFVYRMGLPGMPRNDELPTAAPVQLGAARAVAAVGLVLVALTLSVKVDPSDRSKLKACPEAERAVASL